MWRFFFFFEGYGEALGGGLGAVRKDKGGTRPGIHRPPHLLLKPRSARPAGRLWCWSPRTGHGGCARKNVQDNMRQDKMAGFDQWAYEYEVKNCYRKRILKCHFRNIAPVGKWDREWGGTTVVLIAVPQFLEGLVCLSPERVRPGRQFLMVTLHPRRLMRQRTANLLFTWYVWICTNRVVMPKAPFLMRVKFESSCSLR